MVPKKSESINLITPTGLSSSYVAYGAIRILPTFMMLGQSAATTACLAIANDVPVQDVTYPELRKQLLLQNQILDIPAIWREYVEIENR